MVRKFESVGALVIPIFPLSSIVKRKLNIIKRRGLRVIKRGIEYRCIEFR